MADEVLIRPAVESDLAAITLIYADAVSTGTASYELEPPSRSEMKCRWRMLVEKNYPYLVAERGGSIVGYCYAGPYRPRPAYRYTVENAVYVASDTRRCGIGRQLLQAIIKTCEDRGFRQMIAIIGDGNNHKASAGLHAALGFRKVGIIEGSGYKFGRWLDTLVMQRPLGEGKSGPPSDIN